MKKRLLSILIVLCLCLSVLSACASSGETAGFTGSAEPASDMTDAGDAAGIAEQSAVDNTAGLEAGDGIVEPIVEAQYTISEVLSDFSEDRAWISYRDNGEIYYGIIDPNGFLIYSIAQADLDGWSNGVKATKFMDGISCIYSDAIIYGTSSFREANGMIIVDRDGTPIFNSLEAEDNHFYYYMGYGDGTILAVENIADFSTNTYSLCEIDLTGEIVFRMDFTADWSDSYVKDDFRYMGSDIFAGHLGLKPGIYNRSTHCIFEVHSTWAYDTFQNLQLLTEFSEGIALGYNSRYSGGGTDKIYQIPLDALSSQESWQTYNTGNNTPIGNFYCSGISSGGLINDPTGIYDYNGQLLVAYPENWNITSARAFSDGYAILLIEGVDGKDYVVAVDKNGTPQYEPIKYDGYISSTCGYVLLKIDGENRAFDPAGTEITEGEYEKLQIEYLYGGVKRSEDDASFIDMDGNILSTIYVVSNYDEVSGQIYHMQNPDSASDNAATGSKDYITLSNFSIEGKWKNVGTYTFGQVQSGAIVAFDGTNCNFFSPKDTYAFYQDGDDYKLECTSLLSTDTLTFTVKIVDENNIDVFNGSNCLEMTRVE